MKNKLIFSVLVVVVIANLVMNIRDNQSSKKIGYVRSQDLVYAFDGMKEMQIKFQEKAKVWEANTDTLKMEYQRSIDEYGIVRNQLTEAERQMREQLLRAQQSNLIQYAENIELKSRKEEEEMLEGVLNQVNQLVEVYGKENSYDLILGTTNSGSILFGEEAMDITQEVILSINKAYNGK